MYKEALEIAKEAAVLAGEEILKYYNNTFEIEYKEDESPLTSADKAADAVINKLLKGKFPDIMVLSEESVDDKARLKENYCWIVDPLDGTKEFIEHSDEFTVNIALTKHGEPIIGVVYVPVTKCLYYAAKHHGSFYEKDGEVMRNHVSNRRRRQRLLSSKHHKGEPFLQLVEDNARHISAVEGVGSSLKGCLIARGLAEAYYRFGHTCEWDTAAVHIIVEEAGGYFRQMDHSHMIYNREDVVNRKGFYIINRLSNVFVNKKDKPKDRDEM